MLAPAFSPIIPSWVSVAPQTNLSVQSNLKPATQSTVGQAVPNPSVAAGNPVPAAPVSGNPMASSGPAPVRVDARPTQASNQTVLPAVASKPVRAPGWVAWEEWTKEAGWGKPERVRNVPNLTFRAASSHGQLEITVGRRTAIWNGLNLDLGFAPRATNGEPLVHSLDLEKTLQPLTLQPALLERPGRIIVIDPGHGGFNFGAKSAANGRFEKEFALDWAFRLERLLTDRGWTVRLTRTNDVDLPLPDRVAFADSVNADLFISLHFNSTEESDGAADAGGIETYCLTPVGIPSSLTRRYDDEMHTVLPNNAFDAENYCYAARLHAALVQATKRKDRGVRRARFMGVLRTQNRPAVLVEGGYLTNPAEARLIGAPSYRQKLAEAVARALVP
jgi:N-acetylmuramoyl-L-alanine amidase